MRQPATQAGCRYVAVDNMGDRSASLRGRKRASAALSYKGKVLMVKHKAEDGTEWWAIPGGKREESDETLQETALRELQNATGLKCEDWMRQLKSLTVKTGKETTYYVYEIQERLAGAEIQAAFERRNGKDMRRSTECKWSDELVEREMVRREDATIMKQLSTLANQQLTKFNFKTSF